MSAVVELPIKFTDIEISTLTALNLLITNINTESKYHIYFNDDDIRSKTNLCIELVSTDLTEIINNTSNRLDVTPKTINSLTEHIGMLIETLIQIQDSQSLSHLSAKYIDDILRQCNGVIQLINVKLHTASGSVVPGLGVNIIPIGGGKKNTRRRKSRKRTRKSHKRHKTRSK
jgi:hypothetical protein